VGHEQLETEDFELAARLNTAYRKIRVVGKTVFVPPIYSSRRTPYEFKIHELRFLHHLNETNDFDKACDLAQISPSRAKNFLKSKDYKEFATEAIHDQAIQDGWTPRRVVVEFDRIYQGEKKLSDLQMDALKELRGLVVPKKLELSGNPGGLTVNLNFPVLPDDVKARLKALGDEAATIDTQADAA
jgi:hypothetical protein